MDFEKLVSFRKCGHEGVDNLLWVTTDKGAYGNEKDGPLFDWLQESPDFMYNVKKFDTVIQAGGNCGMYPRFYGNYFRRVITFEPEELNFYCLDKNCVGEKYVKYQGGLGEKSEKLSMRATNMTNVGTHKILEKPGNIQMYRIDDLELDSCDLIHLDIEGYEEKALRGAEKTIRKFLPPIITERSGGKSFLEKLGYRTFKKLRMDTVFVFHK